MQVPGELKQDSDAFASQSLPVTRKPALRIDLFKASLKNFSHF